MVGWPYACTFADVWERSVTSRPEQTFLIFERPEAEATGKHGALRAWCEERLSKPKRPHEFTLLDELPRTSVGKIRKFLLAAPDAAAADQIPTADQTAAANKAPSANREG